jgi:hypothetical protein
MNSRYGNIDGVMTLTNNPLAIDNAKGTIGRHAKDSKEHSQRLRKAQ